MPNQMIKSVRVIVEPLPGNTLALTLFESPNFSIMAPDNLFSAADAAMSLHGSLVQLAATNDISWERMKPLSDKEREALLDGMGPRGCVTGYFMSTTQFRYNVFCRIDPDEFTMSQVANNLGVSRSTLDSFSRLGDLGEREKRKREGSSHPEDLGDKKKPDIFSRRLEDEKKWWQFWK